MDTTTIKGHRLYRAHFESSRRNLLSCGRCLLEAHRFGGVLEGSVSWPGDIETKCDLCGRVASARTEKRPGRQERLMLARSRLLRWMNQHTLHPAAARANQRLYWIEETLRGRF